ncbi:MAG TPA: VWA domain-containing protein [Allosphingosinicella sp.]|uniref:vWA domain-containing protein n=1 Tax=Allosphingosinicella sp. TaxID=2823234 RepID=UPI002F292D77
MTLLKANASKLLSGILAVSVVATLLAGLMSSHSFTTREDLKTFDVSESFGAKAFQPVHESVPAETPRLTAGEIVSAEQPEVAPEPMPAPLPGLVAPPPLLSMKPAPPVSAVYPENSRFQELQTNRETAVTRAPVSTFSVDVDTASYANIRRIVRAGEAVPPEAVRVEEMLNYFRYDLALPQQGAPVAITTDVVRTPWNDRTLLLRVALAARDVPPSARPAANLVFLVDVSGSMSPPDRLELVKRALSALAEQVRPQDRVAIVTYADGSAVALPPTSDRARIKRAVARLRSGGATAGGEGIALAYQQARLAFVSGGINRVVLATDGDFNVGVSDPAALKMLVERERDRGVTLSTLGVGEYNDRLMETLADAGDGNASFIDGDAEIRKVLGRELSGTLQVVAKDVKAQVEFNPDAIQSYRQIGYENRQLAERDFGDDRIDAGDVGAGHQVTALYEITPTTGNVASHRRYAANRAAGGQTNAVPEALFVKVRYKDPSGGRSLLLEQAVSGELMTRAREPAGDTAFAAAVAAFGQHLRGDPAIVGFGRSEILGLAGPQRDPLRREFLDLVRGLPASPGAGIDPPLAAPHSQSDQAESEGASGAILAFLVLILGAAFAFILRSSIRAASVGTANFNDGPSSCPAVAEADRAAALSSDADTRTTIAHFTKLLTRARMLQGCDADVTAEIDAIAERHAPGYLREYAAARARAADGREAELERNLRAALEILSTRLAELLDQQTSRDVQRMDGHQSFLRQRHFGAPPLQA